ncbi:MAG TPA: exosome complex protein Rrp42 [Candidatus Methanofastidiosa archaeon]|nr:exosome complex protein Rrp42 [Candidatus Methanofastidiosa archaeon]HPR40975.1 exosome complex protein Rrp42 [Candidatus Methanofastidiosa archaeon]
MDAIANIKREYINNLAIEGKRLDERAPDEYRELKIIPNYIKKAEGSAYVELGATKVIVGVKYDVGTPFPDIPNEGVMTTSAELPPLASPEFESGPPGEDAIELARVVDRGIRESKALDTGKLCIVPGELVRIVFVDIQVLDDGGNLLDACGIGAITALKCAKMPIYNAEGNPTDEIESLPLRKVPVTCTIAKIGGKLLVDPQKDEEKIMASRITVSTDEDGNVVAMQKGIDGSFKLEEVMEAVRLAKIKGQENREKILKAIEEAE